MQRTHESWRRTGQPHVCGDYKTKQRYPIYDHGPSPRVWGLPPRPLQLNAAWRAIPTCVGTTPSPYLRGRRTAGHPHVCGDYAIAWGRNHRAVRAIPTCVGTTVLRTDLYPVYLGHPHVCGDYEEVVDGVELRVRAIPTCVGTTQDPDGKNPRRPPSMCL